MPEITVSSTCDCVSCPKVSLFPHGIGVLVTLKAAFYVLATLIFFHCVSLEFGDRLVGG